MAADNVQANPGASGAIFRTFSDGTNEWPASIVAYANGGSAGAWTLQQVDATHGLPVAVLGTAAVTQSGSWSVAIGAALPAGGNVIGAVTQSGTWNVTVNTALPAGTNVIGGVELVDSAGTNKASISAAGALKVDGSTATQPVSGTVTANQGGAPWSNNLTQVGGSAVALGQALMAASFPVVLASNQAAISVSQSGTWTVQPGNTANTTPWLFSINAGGNTATVTAGNALKVDGSAVTQPVSGAITANAGTGTFTVSGTVTANAGTGTFATSDLADGPVTPGTVATKSLLVGMQYNSSAPAPTTGQQLAFQCDANGNLLVNVKAGGGSGGTSSTFSAAFPGTGTAAGASDGTNMKPLLVDASGFLKVNVAAGGGSGGTSSSFAAAFPATGTAIGFKDNSGNMAAGNLDASGFLKVNVAAGSSGNAAASATGSAVPSSADYTGINVGGNLRGQTGVNPTGTVYAAQTDLTSVGGTSVALGQTTMSASIPVVIASNQSAVAVSGTVTANAGTGTFTVSGTVTANIGTTNGVALDASVNGILVAQGSTTSGEKGPLIQGAVTTGPPTYTTAQTSPLSLTAAGGLRHDLSSVGGTAITLGQAAMAASLPVVIASNQTAFPVSQSGTWNIASIQNALPAGANTIGAVSQNGTWAVGLSAGTNTIGNVVPVAGASGGATAYHLVSAATTNTTSVKASAGQVYGVQCFNTNASPRYLKFFNKASTPVLGTDTPLKTIMMPGNSNGAGAVAQFPVGIAFSTGIAFAITANIADADNTAVGLNDCVINFDYA